MPIYSISAPDGNTYKIEGPEGASQEQVQAEVLKQHPNAATPKAVPEKGNMYTQGAEDIVYSPEGIPLTTSSYGSAPTGATEHAKDVLTSTVSLPINIATGIAKTPSAVMQAYDKLIGGGKTGDKMINAINQIESGTQSQMGGMGNVINQGGSILGQTAPFVMSPIKTGAPTMLENLASKSAPYVDKAINALPSNLQNLVPNVAKGLAVGSSSAMATPEQTGLTPEQFKEAKGQNLAIQGGLGVAFPVAGSLTSKLAETLRGTKMSPQMNLAIEKARENGYTIPPTQAGGGIVSRLLEGLAGKASTLQEASVRNQNVTNKLAIKSLGLPEETVLTPEVLANIRSEAGKTYDALSTLPKKPAVVADSTMNRFAMPEIDPKKMVYDLRVARNEADGYYNAYSRSAHPEDLAKAKALKAKANQIESDLEKYAIDMGKTDLLPQLRDARQLIAKTYTVENAMNKTTGSVDAKALANRLQKGKPMSDELTNVAEFAQAFPKAVQMPEKIGGTIGISPLDYTAAGLTGASSMLLGEDRGTTSATTLAALLARPTARKLVLSNPMQNRLVQKEIGNLASDAEKENLRANLAKMLIMQSAGKAAQ